MRGDVFVTNSFTQMARNALCETARVYKYECGLVLANELGQAIVNFVPDLARHNCRQRRLGQFDVVFAHTIDRWPEVPAAGR